MNNVLHTNKRNFNLSLFFYLYEEEIYQMPKDEIRSDAHTHTHDKPTNRENELCAAYMYDGKTYNFILCE
jgi:hypothetical protein